MVFSSLTFIFIFLPLFLIFYYISPFKFKNIILLLFSLLFYSWGEPIYIIILLLSSLVDYVNGFLINRYNNNPKIKRIFLINSIIVNLSLLGIFKYSNFLISNLNLLGLNISIGNIALPLGISFFTFQTMSYSIDVYLGNIKYEKNFINFMTYVCMFPQLVAGPIVRYSDISKELNERKTSFEAYTDGTFRFLTGLFKKVLIANNMGIIFSIITKDINSVSLGSAWLGAIAFALQIYFDFSGYSDMAIGIGKMLGFSYPENFNYPYIATSITDFWRRWHITLSTWFRDYVYIPLGGNRCSKKRQILNMFIVWFLTGLWHGANWNFIIWGLYFFVLLVIDKYTISKLKIPLIIKRIMVIILILISWVIFAFDDLNMLKCFLSKMFLNNTVIDNTLLFCLNNYFFLIITGILLSTPILRKLNLNRLAKHIIIPIYILLFIITVASLVSDTYNPFLYFRF